MNQENIIELLNHWITQSTTKEKHFIKNVDLQNYFEGQKEAYKSALSLIEGLNK